MNKYFKSAWKPFLIGTLALILLLPFTGINSEELLHPKTFLEWARCLFIQILFVVWMVSYVKAVWHAVSGLQVVVNKFFTERKTN